MSNDTTPDTGLDTLLDANRLSDGRSAPASPPLVAEISVDELKPGRYQPRRRFAEDGLAELADSIREQGVLQPLLVRVIEPPNGSQDTSSYEIVAGERRWQAAKIAGLPTVPVIIRELSDQSALAVALIENLQREDLNPIDQAQSLSRLASEFQLTHEQVARAVGRSRPSVSNLLRLLELTAEVKDLLAHGKIDMGHARALLPLDAQRQVTMARRTQARGLSVRQVEKAVQTLLLAPADGASARPGLDLQTRWLQAQIIQELGRNFAIRAGKDGDYTLHIGFGDLAQLQDALHRVQELIAQVRNAAGPRARETNSLG
jgi:ParB family transcriptional regulator, chromosome partitioning protein